jgi:hypothetical protein
MKKIELETVLNTKVEFYDLLTMDAKNMTEWGIEVNNEIWKVDGKEFDINDAIAYCFKRGEKIIKRGVVSKKKLLM